MQEGDTRLLRISQVRSKEKELLRSSMKLDTFKEWMFQLEHVLNVSSSENDSETLKTLQNWMHILSVYTDFRKYWGLPAKMIIFHSTFNTSLQTWYKIVPGFVTRLYFESQSTNTWNTWSFFFMLLMDKESQVKL